MRLDEPEILADIRTSSAPRGRALLVGAGIGLSLAVVSAVATVPGSQLEAIRITRVVETVVAAPVSIVEQDLAPFIHMERIHPGDTLGSILARLGASDDEAIRFISSTPMGSRAVRGLRAGRSISAAVGDDGRLDSLDIPLAGDEIYALTRSPKGFVEEQRAAPASPVIKMRSGTITSSLFGAAEKAGLPDEATMKLAELFGTEIDFHTDLRTGDSFSVVYEAETRDGVEIGVGRILAAEFTNQGKLHTVIHYRDASGDEGYYTPDGRNLKQAFLRSPLAFTRVTSGFAMRFHPIKKAWRQHKGVDFGASAGTAIKATSGGSVEFVGQKGGYGNTVILKHRNNITTLYAHMSRFPSGLKRGARVSQGDVIGFVGSTGWATGPHLHYEFRKSGAPVDPMAITLPSADPLDAKELTRFRTLRDQRLAQLELLNYKNPLTVAQLD